jgi:beta-phosphoglucomutase
LKAVIFDMDGVLVDSFEAHRKAFDLVMSRHYGFHVNAEEFISYFGTNPKDIARGLLKTHGIPNGDIEKLTEEKKVAFRQFIKEGVKVLPGVKALLEKLKQDGTPIAVASTPAKESVLLTLETAGLRQYFNVIVGLDDVRLGKPAPDIYLKAAEILGIKPKDCWVVEDSLSGIQAGKAAGMKVVGVQTGFHSRKGLLDAGAEIVVENLEKLKTEDLNLE